MGDAGELKLPEVRLQTAEHEELLNIVDTLRSHGASNIIALPQLIVCGDQSSGKSSVLEAISGLRFPTKDNLCTRFATELILRHGRESTMMVKIQGGDDRTEEEKARLASFRPRSTSIENFADIVHAAEKVMGLGPEKMFSSDILSVELCGPTQPHLTLVDLPGIFHTSDGSQSHDDAEIVKALVTSYMEKARTIILAVVSAKNDLAMQTITELSKQADPTGERTLGVITKPDLLHAGSDSENVFVKLAKNKNDSIKFGLGWHVLKNRDYDTRNTSTAERDEAERQFLAKSVWQTAIPSSNLGVANLRPRLSKILLREIVAQLPGLVQDVQWELKDCKSKLDALGGPRNNILDQKLHLLKIGQTFSSLLTASVSGIYVDSFFGSSDADEGYAKRLRAVVKCTMADFATRMRLEGHAQRIQGSTFDTNSKVQIYQLAISREEYLDSVKVRMRRNQGQELPGLFNPSIVGDLFFDQAKPWQRILSETEEALTNATKKCVELILGHCCDEGTKEGIMRHIIRLNMEPLVARLHEKVKEVLKPHTRGHPVTFNHYFTDNLQKNRRDEARKAMAKKVRAFFVINNQVDALVNRSFTVTALLNALTVETEADMELFAATEAASAMEAYYKVALKSVIDTFGMYAIEECLLGGMVSIFKPEIILELPDETITRIAGESAESVVQREELSKKLKVLEETTITLQRIKTVTNSAPLFEKVSQAEEGNGTS